MSRCVHCSRPREAHAEDLRCPGSTIGKYATMDTPSGYTCSDCGYFRFCSEFLGDRAAGSTRCDWYPVRFVPRIEKREAVRS